MKFVKNKLTEETWKIPCSNYYVRIYECIKHTKIGTIVNFVDSAECYDQGWATSITPRGVNISTTTRTVFVKWENVLGVFVD